MSKPAVFLDRDGTLIEHYDYLTEPDQVALKPAAGRALRLLRERDYLLVVVTNQSAVGRGMLTEERLAEIHERLKRLLAEERIFLDGIYYCPYHPEAVVEEYRRVSDLRKPEPGMLLAAARDLGIDLERSWMIGDDARDVLAGKNAGCRTIFLESYRPSPLVQQEGVEADYVAVNLQEAANQIVRYGQQGGAEEMESARVASTAEPASEDDRVDVAGEPLPQAVGTAQDVAEPEPQAETAPRIDDDIMAAPGTEPEQDHDDAHDEDESQVFSSDDHDAETTAAPQPRRVRVVKKKIKKKRSDHSSDGDESNRDLLMQILRELKAANRERHFSEFSIFRLLAVLVQMLVLLCLVLAFYFRSVAESDPETVRTCLSVGTVLQVMTLTLLLADRQA